MKASCLILALSGVWLPAQPVEPVVTHKFEVISIRRHSVQNGPVQAGSPLGPTADGFRSIGLPMLGIFQWAYALPNHSGLLRGNQIEGDPKWLSDELYDIVAKVDRTDLASRRVDRSSMRRKLSIRPH
jgi:uncharacterized protein (TIGR03435 family)